jgi:hypothetical protein
VIPGKGHDVLVDALAPLTPRRQCLCVGSPRAHPAISWRACAAVSPPGMDDRVRFPGLQSGA